MTNQIGLYYEVAKDQKAIDTWRVEAIDELADGAVYVAVFSGPDAEARAYEYAYWKNDYREGYTED